MKLWDDIISFNAHTKQRYLGNHGEHSLPVHLTPGSGPPLIDDIGRFPNGLSFSLQVPVIGVKLTKLLSSWPEIADMNDLNSVIRVIKKLYRESMENFQQSLTLLCGSLLATFVDV